MQGQSLSPKRGKKKENLFLEREGGGKHARGGSVLKKEREGTKKERQKESGSGGLREDQAREEDRRKKRGPTFPATGGFKEEGKSPRLPPSPGEIPLSSLGEKSVGIPPPRDPGGKRTPRYNPTTMKGRAQIH